MAEENDKEEIDALIHGIRTLKSTEVDATLGLLDWAAPHADTMRKMGLSNKDLRSLRLFGNTRKSSLVRACNVWEAAEDALEKYAYGADAAVALLLAPRHTHKR